MTKIDKGDRRARAVYFAHNLMDAVYPKRRAMLERSGFDFNGFAFDRRRNASDKPPVENGYVLGRARDGDLASRLISIATSIIVLWQNRRIIQSADILIARNLDLLLLAYVSQSIFGSTGALYYECLDIHPALTDKGWRGKLIRSIERILLKKTQGVILSSSAFLSHYFSSWQSYKGRAFLLENKLLRDPVLPREREPREGKIRIGFVGILRCRVSLLLLIECVRLTPAAELHLYGVPDRNFIPDFEDIVRGIDRVFYFGRFSTTQLDNIYEHIDLIWVADLSSQFNAKWLLPNRLYEGGRRGCIPIAIDGSEVADWLLARDLGVTLTDNQALTLHARISTLTSQDISRLRTALLATKASLFVHDSEELMAFRAWLLRE
ncbi:hypothetical protein [Bradyrhizobium liaoningense]|uniref:hypothetical protein n=1 Tax=Bradyrhizobium liaoningense TaxID=43992 RepID=UPI001BA97660|nr:hypothetical protein [Bradyrhizobium liaoningense]MBR0987617.1 hypothetical protein [Bradyrhizobium liaoningense]